ncbi:response regulator [Psychrosphaera aestuarii]|uniref:response regulator n=1 Tax=Psychrosphaera aestuarii TaxID=1266052 RepID=UPI001B335FE3|nr:response regulator [Psychrosphaera aestuarii]
MVAKVATYIFNELGFNVLLATDGVEALQILDKNSDISLLFTDIILPNGIDGKELATKIRNKIPSLPVIYTSGFTDGKLSKEDYQQFNTQFLQKPYTKNDLLLTINNISFD